MTGKVVVTGANGFIGKAVCRSLRDWGYDVVAAGRRADGLPDGIAFQAVGGIGPDTDWRDALTGARAVVHLAARVHVMAETDADPLAAFRHVNTAGTLALAQQAAHAGVGRFVYMSSIKVNGEETRPGHPFAPQDAPAPCDPYGVSKWEAEQGLARLARHTGLEVAVLRPPLVYGPGVKGNFLSLMKLVARGLPLPLGLIDNRRSLIYVENLAACAAVCITRPEAAGLTVLPSDGEDLSTAALIRRLAQALGCPARLLPLPPALLRLAGLATGRSTAVARLCGSLQVADPGLEDRLGWRPPFSLDQGFAATANWFKSAGKQR